MKERRILIDPSEEISVRSQCNLLGIHRSGIYYAPAGEKEENLILMRLMDERQLDYPTHGILQMQDYLRDEGYTVNYKRVRRLLRLMGLRAIYPQKNLSKLGLAKYIYPYLLRNLKIDRPNQVWEIDITYIPMEKGFMYLTVPRRPLSLMSIVAMLWAGRLHGGDYLIALRPRQAFLYFRKPLRGTVSLRSSTQTKAANLLVRNGWNT